MASLGEMAGGIDHEINNPLAIVKANAEFISEYLLNEPSVNVENVRARVGKIIGTTERIARTVVGMKRISKQSDPAITERYSLKKLVTETLGLCEMRVKNAGIKLAFTVSQDVDLNCNPVASSQIIVNLLNNAVDALAQVDNPKIEMVYRIEDGYCVIDVCDNGPGISEEHLRDVMAPFFTTKEKGTGLGLAISKSLAEHQGGELSFENLEVGVKFSVKIKVFS